MYGDNDWDGDDNFGFTNQFGDDPYDSYEDYYLDTGYDPYHVFDDTPTRYSLWRRFKHGVSRLKMRVLNIIRHHSDDDIPF